MNRVCPSLKHPNPAVVSAVRSYVQQERKFNMAAVFPHAPETPALLCEPLQMEAKNRRYASHLKLFGGLAEDDIHFVLLV